MTFQLAMMAINRKISGNNDDVAQEVENELRRLEGKKLKLAHKTYVVDHLQSALQRIEYKVVCPKCGKPSNLRCSVSAKYPEGVLQYDHVNPGERTTHQSDEGFFPRVNLVSISRLLSASRVRKNRIRRQKAGKRSGAPVEKPQGS